MNKSKITTLAVVVLFLIIVATGRSLPPGGQLKFDHKLHVTEVGAECATCHQNVEQSQSGKDRLLPDMNACAECHDIEDENGCVTCHSDPNNIVPSTGAGMGYEAFSHKLHTAKVSCETCHQVQAALAEQGAKYPDMMSCTECHASSRVSATCRQCHVNNEPSPPVSHKVNWQKEHGEEAAFTRAECAMCHEAPGAKSTCTKCHQGSDFGMPHPRNFVHSTAFIRGGGFADCQSCHEAESFCAPCHTQKMVFPSSHSIPGWATTADSPSAGGLHARKGAADLESCIICHANQTQQPTCFSAGCHQ